MSINGASTICVLASRIIKQVCDNIKLWSKCLPPIWVKMAATISLPPPQNECQRSVNHFWCCIMDTPSTVHRHLPISNVSAAFMGKNASDYIATTSKKYASMECQRRDNNFSSCILDNQMAAEWPQPMINSSAASKGKNAKDHSATSPKKWASTERQQFLVLHHVHSTPYASPLTHNQCIGCLYGPKCLWKYRYPHLKWVSTIFGLASWTI